jgi:hypothetical protein
MKSFARRCEMHSASLLEALVDGTVFLSSRATAFPGSPAAESTLVILAQVNEDKQLEPPSSTISSTIYRGISRRLNVDIERYSVVKVHVEVSVSLSHSFESFIDLDPEQVQDSSNQSFFTT